jgi:hypothetical protein
MFWSSTFLIKPFFSLNLFNKNIFSTKLMQRISFLQFELSLMISILGGGGIFLFLTQKNLVQLLRMHQTHPRLFFLSSEIIIFRQ